MNSRGISGFGVIFIIIILLLLGYIGYQIFRIQFSYSVVKSKVEDAAELGPTRTDADIINELLNDCAEANVKLDPSYDTIFIDRSIPDSLRIYVAYNDSSNIFGYIYRRHLVIDVVAAIRAGF